jgi:hypothetical protein
MKIPLAPPVFWNHEVAARRELRAIFVRKTLPYEPMPANATIEDKHRLGRDERAIDWLVTG